MRREIYPLYEDVWIITAVEIRQIWLQNYYNENNLASIRKNCYKFTYSLVFCYFRGMIGAKHSTLKQIDMFEDKLHSNKLSLRTKC